MSDNENKVNLATADLFHAEIARLAALVESLRREVREQRREIAGLREERRAILDADRPMCDRPEAINTGESDRPKPICTPEPHATPGACSVPPKCTDTGGE